MQEPQERGQSGGDGEGAGALPEIVRARGYRLYDARGGRYIDFYQNGGRALLGHRPPGASQALKSTLDRGLVAEYPDRRGGRLERLVRGRFPGVKEVLLFRSMERACRAVLPDLPPESGRETAEPGPESGVGDLTFAEGRELCRRGSAVPLWRPGALEDAEERRLLEGEWGRAFIPLLPFPGGFAPAVLCVLDGGDVHWPPERVSPLLEALLIKCAAALQKWEQTADRSKWEFFDRPGLERRGPYLRFALKGADYLRLQRRLLARGVLLPPAETVPAVIPGEFTPGEVKPLRKELEGLYGNA
jgi:hypothetical protein